MGLLWRHSLVAILSAFWLAGCTSTPSDSAVSQSLSDVLEGDEILSLPYRVYGNGVYMLSMTDASGRTLSYAVDTGATQSALYRSTLKKLNLDAGGTGKITVHGMSQNGARPVVTVPELYLGSKKLSNVRMAILEDRVDPLGQTSRPSGLIGMDILSEFRLFVDAENQVFNLIPKSLPAPRVPASWPRVQLIKNPYKIDTHNLHFIEIRVGNHLIPALLDTGSEENLMNWSVEKFPQLRKARKRLRETWEIEGAVGTFAPQYLITTKNMRSGQKYWGDSQFLVTDFTGLDILGIVDKPFLIAGSALLSKETYYIDFAEDVIRFKPTLQERRARTLTFTSTVYRRNASEQ
ncbi:MAG: aspartyl protease family protein [Alphaproteobacteria bacterium]